MRSALVGLVLACVAAAVGCKSPPPPTSNAKPTNILMAINLGEEDEEGGCGDVIHAVRAAAKSGVRTREIDTRNKTDFAAASKKYRIVKEPTVILLDDADAEVRRYEGESKETIASLKSGIEQMAKK